MGTGDNSIGGRAMSVNSIALPHGGNLQQASQIYGIDIHDWIDLSTGINPRSYPLAPIATEYFHQLPYPSSGLIDVASKYYGSNQLLPIAGTQAAIQVLPQCLPELPILLPKVGYQEHRKHWLRGAAPCRDYPANHAEETAVYIDQQLQENAATHLLLINPNNPTGLYLDKQNMLKWAGQLKEGGHLIVDEAFIDVTPEQSLLTEPLPDNVLVLRSCGKFFGLAGIRLGFAFASPVLRERLSDALGLWPISGPTQAAGIQGLGDDLWQQQARLKITQDSDTTATLFEPLLQQLNPVRQMNRPLFHSYLLAKQSARDMQFWFAKRGILLRLIDWDEDLSLVRVGLLDSTNNEHTQRVKQAVTAAVEAINDGVFYSHETPLPQKA
ncbi:threonine-phosphate decarboxylase CobD [Maricurvus nonylphenolicus]|uniref:aminotransferase class I/II-fold pyridoxal phosphate-dependent enzyme n=1 Tax=Maricurvus nonylphenolicus TaxID=1008307 RepID=UPI0036F32001